MKQYLEASSYIDWHHPLVSEKARQLRGNHSSKFVIAKQCFEFVRDEVRHSVDAQDEQITCRASDVLSHQTGFCYAKSHLLAALLRANRIPAGLCYQRLVVDDHGKLGLHGLNAIYLSEFGWYRVDPRGNKPGIDAQFCPPKEQLAFALQEDGEVDLSGIHASPLAEVVAAMQSHQNLNEMTNNLPDIAII